MDLERRCDLLLMNCKAIMHVSRVRQNQYSKGGNRILIL